MKKLLSVIVCCLIIFTITACNNQTSGENSQGGKSATTSQQATNSINSTVNQTSSTQNSQQTSTNSTSSNNSTNFNSTSKNSAATSNSTNNTQSSPTSATPQVIVPTGTVTNISQAQKNGVPIIIMTTQAAINSKVTATTGTISIYKKDGTKDLENAAIEDVRLRGNTTATFDKKPYTFKFTSKKAPLGLGTANKKWNLLANMCDHSFIRNSIGLNLCKALNVNFVPNYSEAELYLNGQYQGLYLLCEAVNIQDGRVEVTEDPDKIEDAGYLVQISKNTTETVNIFNDSEGVKYEIKNDLSTSSSTYNQQVTYVKGFMDSALAAIKSKNESQIKQLINFDSAVNAYIIEELLNNMDVGWDSFYFTKEKTGKLVFGPLWDFDVSLGNGNDNSQYAEGFNACKNIDDHSNLWFYYLSQCDFFRTAVSQKWQTSAVQTAITNMKASIDTISTKIQTPALINFKKWSTVSGSKLVKINFEPDAVLSETTYAAQVTYVKNWLNTRVTWLDGQFKSQSYLNGTMPIHAA